MTRFALFASALLLCTSIAPPEPALAQSVVVYGALQPEYRLGSFRYRPPMKDGWRQVTSEPSAMRLVYVESLGENTLNTRADLVAEAFPVPDPALVPSGLHLTSSGLSQQMEQRGDLLLGYTRISELESELETYSYTLAVKLGEDKKRYETFFVVLSPDKSEYLVAKLTIDEENYENLPFFVDSYDSIKAIDYVGSTSEAASEGDGEPKAESGDDEAVVPDDDSSPTGE